MTINWRDVWTAIHDLQLELTFTIGALFVLLILGTLIGFIASRMDKRAARASLETETPEPKSKPQIVTRKPVLTTTEWREQRRAKISEPEIKPEIKPEPKQAASPEPNGWLWWANFMQGLSTEFYGAVVTTIFLGMMILITQQYQAIQNRKAELILQMGSPTDGGFAIEAVRQLREEGWLIDGSLQGSNLIFANLQGAWLFESNLQGVSLDGANLQSASLTSFWCKSVLCGKDGSC